MLSAQHTQPFRVFCMGHSIVGLVSVGSEWLCTFIEAGNFWRRVYQPIFDITIKVFAYKRFWVYVIELSLSFYFGVSNRSVCVFFWSHSEYSSCAAYLWQAIAFASAVFPESEHNKQNNNNNNNNSSNYSNKKQQQAGANKEIYERKKEIVFDRFVFRGWRCVFCVSAENRKDWFLSCQVATTRHSRQEIIAKDAFFTRQIVQFESPKNSNRLERNPLGGSFVIIPRNC